MRHVCMTVLCLVAGLCGAIADKGSLTKAPETRSAPRGEFEAAASSKVSPAKVSERSSDSKRVFAAIGAKDGRPPEAPENESGPDVKFANAVLRKVGRDEATWHEVTLKLTRAVESYDPSSSDLIPERESLEAFRQYCWKLLESGRNVEALFEKWTKASDGLSDSLRKAPAYYRRASLAWREKGAKMQFKRVREEYMDTADIWEQLALKAEERVKELGLDTDSKGVVAFIREENTFLADFVTNFDSPVSQKASGHYEELIGVLRVHAQQSDELHRQLKLFRDKLKANPDDGAGSK